jgi:hypothetical protein
MFMTRGLRSAKQLNRSAVAACSREGVNAFPLGLEVPQLLLAQVNEVIE